MRLDDVSTPRKLARKSMAIVCAIPIATGFMRGVKPFEFISAIDLSRTKRQAKKPTATRKNRIENSLDKVAMCT